MLLCPSLMCADYGNLRATIEDLDAAGIDIFHCDVMDGSFVPNFAMGLEDIKAVRAATNKLVDVHLMVENPASKVELFASAGADIIYIHPESERYVVKTLAAIKSLGKSVSYYSTASFFGKSAGIAVNPDTSISEVEEMLNLCDYVMVMTVNPGFAGQSFIEFTNDKVRRLVALKERFGFKLMIDGACSPERVRDLSAIGADGFILGTSALFGKDAGYEECLRRLRAGEVY